VRPRIISGDEVRANLGMSSAISVVRRAFRAAHSGAVSPAPFHLDIETLDGHCAGELHIKGAHITGEPFFAVKASSGFPGNAARGLSTSHGFTTVFDAETGQLQAVVLDDGYLTELRTGAAGAVANDLLAIHEVDVAVVVGTGGQARHQIDGLLAVRRPASLVVAGRRDLAVQELVTWVRQEHDVDVRGTTDIRTAVRDAPLVVTVTGARSPILQPGWLSPGSHVTAVGSDSPGKRELHPDLLRRADLFAADDLTQSKTVGELQDIDVDRMRRPATTIGALLIEGGGRVSAEDLTIADLTGLGLQDAAIATALLEAM